MAAHNWALPHNHRGDGKMTLCPQDCPGHEEWLAKQQKEAGEQ